MAIHTIRADGSVANEEHHECNQTHYQIWISTKQPSRRPQRKLQLHKPRSEDSIGYCAAEKSILLLGIIKPGKEQLEHLFK